MPFIYNLLRFSFIFPSFQQYSYYFSFFFKVTFLSFYLFIFLYLYFSFHDLHHFLSFVSIRFSLFLLIFFFSFFCTIFFSRSLVILFFFLCQMCFVIKFCVFFHSEFSFIPSKIIWPFYSLTFNGYIPMLFFRLSLSVISLLNFLSLITFLFCLFLFQLELFSSHFLFLKFTLLFSVFRY